jgi:hypothetical protein
MSADFGFFEVTEGPFLHLPTANQQSKIKNQKSSIFNLQSSIFTVARTG